MEYTRCSLEARRQASRPKHDTEVRAGALEPGDPVLIRNLGLRGEQKFLKWWYKDFYAMIGQSDLDLPIYRVRK